MASAVLFLFSASIMMFQISCSKDANAGTSLINGTASKIVYLDNNRTTIYIKNADGTGTTTSINITLPSGYTLKQDGDTDLSSDGNHIYFIAYGTKKSIFRCDMNGANVTKLTSETDISGIFNIF